MLLRFKCDRRIAVFTSHTRGRQRFSERDVSWTKEMAMADEVSAKLRVRPRGDESGHFGARQRGDHPGRGGTDRGGRRHLCLVDRNQRLRAPPEVTRKMVSPAICGVQPALSASGRVAVTTRRGIFAVDLLQVQQTEIISSNIGCNSGGRALPEIHADKLAAVLRFASRGHSG